MTFNSGQFDHLCIVLLNECNSGTAWFDEVAIEGLEVVNGGFEELVKPDRARGWQYFDTRDEFSQISPLAYSGKRSHKITAPPRDAYCLRQVVACDPETQYTLSFSARVDKSGIGRVEVHGVNRDEPIGRIRRRWGKGGVFLAEAGLPSYNPTLPERALVVEEHLRAEKTFRLDPRSPFMVTLEIMIPGTVPEVFWGPRPKVSEDDRTEVRIEVVDGSGDPIVSAMRDASTGTGLPVRLVGFAPDDGLITVGLRRTGKEQAMFYNIEVGEPDATVPIRQARWGGRAEAFEVPRQCRVMVEPAFDRSVIQTALGLLRHATGGDVTWLIVDSNDGPFAIKYAQSVGGKEDYRLRVDSTGITVWASASRGAYHALVTLWDLLVREAEQYLLPACEIEDGPDFPIRWFYGGSAGVLPIVLRLKINGITTSSGGYWGDREKRPDWCPTWVLRDIADEQKLATLVRAHGMDYIYICQSLGHAEQFEMWRNANWGEGIAVIDENHTLNGVTPVTLDHRNVIRTAISQVEVKNEAGRPYKQDQDFRVTGDGVRFPIRPQEQAAPVTIARTTSGAILDGATVLVSYDYLPLGPGAASGGHFYSLCPSEPEGLGFNRANLQRIMAQIGPQRYVHLALDEVRWAHSDGVTDRRCLATEKTAGRLLAEYINAEAQAVWEVAPNAEVIVFDDSFRKDADALEYLDKKIIMDVWVYDADRTIESGWPRIEELSARGFRTIGTPWYDYDNVRRWAEIGAEARKHGWPFLGIYAFSGGGAQGKGQSGIPLVGRWGWRTPEPIGSRNDP
jgi:hypothetical protein